MYIFSVLAGVDSLYWFIFKERDSRIPPYEWWIRSAVCAVGGAGGVYAASRLLEATDPLTMAVGAIIGGRLVGGMIETFRKKG